MVNHQLLELAAGPGIDGNGFHAPRDLTMAELQRPVTVAPY